MHAAFASVVEMEEDEDEDEDEDEGGTTSQTKPGAHRHEVWPVKLLLAFAAE